MRIEWIFSDEAKEKLKAFVSKYEDHIYVIERLQVINSQSARKITKQFFWRGLLGSFLTTQQKSGSDSRVARFLNSDNQLLQWEYCQNHEDIAQKAEEVFAAQGLRFTKRNAGFIESALALIKDEWQDISSRLETIVVKSSEEDAIRSERAVAQYFQKFKGIGPKQSRNLIQYLGLSRYEIPLDSRIMEVLRSKFGFPVPLSAAVLSDEQYYCFVEDAIQKLLSQVSILPCVFDACAFASMEKS